MNTPYTTETVLDRWAAEANQPLLPSGMRVKLLPHTPAMNTLSPKIHDQDLQELVTAFVQVMYLEWLMYEADLRKLEYKLNMHRDDEDIWEYNRMNRKKTSKLFNKLYWYSPEDVQGVAVVQTRQSKITAELAQPAVVMATMALQYAPRNSKQQPVKVGNVFKYLWARTNKTHVRELLPKFPVHYTWDFM